MKKLILALSGSMLMVVGSLAQAADLAAGQAAFSKFTCSACHGADAKTTTSPAYPILAGQHEDYLLHALTAYKRGQSGAPATANIRKNAIMGAMASSLSDADMSNIAAWLSSLPTPLSIQK